MDILARAAEQPVASDAGLAIFIVVGLVVTVLTGMSRNIASGRTGDRHLRRAEQQGRERMESGLHDAVTRRLAELPPEPRPTAALDLTTGLDLTGEGHEPDASEDDEHRVDVDLTAEDPASAEDRDELETTAGPVDPDPVD
ncbi:MAG: hypothetical protein AAFZ07_25920 [Actinomycetota bacterium]